MADGSIKFDIELEDTVASDNVKQLRKEVNELEHELSKTDSKKMTNLADSMEENNNAINQGVEKLKTYQEQLQRLNYDLNDFKLEGDNIFEGEQFTEGQKLQQQIDLIREKQSQVKTELKEQNEIQNVQILSADKYFQKTEDIRKSIERVDTKNIADNTAKAVVETKKLDNSVKSVANSTDRIPKSLNKGVKSITRTALALFSIRSIYGAISRLGRQAINSTEEWAVSARGVFSTFSQGLSNALAPVIKSISSMLLTLMGYINAITQAFFGITLFSGKTDKNIGSSVGGAKKLNKELKKINASFDTAEVISSQLDDNLGGAGGGGVSTPDIAIPIIPVPDISGVMKALEKIKNMFMDIWDSDYVQSVFNSLTTIAINYFNFFKSIGSNIWDNLKETFSQVLPIYLEGTNNILELWRSMLEDMSIATTEWLPRISESINSFVDSVFETFNPIIVFITEIWRDFWGIIKDLWNKHGKPLLDTFFGFVDSTIKLFEKIWDIVDAIISPILDALKDIWESTLKDLVYDVLDFIAELIIMVGNIYNNFIAPIVGFLLEVLQPIFATVFGAIGGIIAGAVNAIITIFTPVITFFKGVIQIISGLFSGDWTRIWQGAVNIVKSIFGAIVNVVKVPINFMIDLLNGFIRGLNRIKIPNWVPGVGGKGINIGQIPRLAKGGVLRQPTLNLAGEYAGARTNPEIVTPQKLLDERIAKGLANLENIQGNNQPIIIKTIIEMEGKQIAEVVNEYNDQKSFNMNGGLVWNT